MGFGHYWDHRGTLCIGKYVGAVGCSAEVKGVEFLWGGGLASGCGASGFRHLHGISDSGLTSLGALGEGRKTF